MLYASGYAARFKTKVALFDGFSLVQSYRTEGTHKHAGVTAHALFFVYKHRAVRLLAKCARYTAFYAYRVVAVAAGNGK